MKPAVGDTLYMYNMDITFIDDELVDAAEMELKAEAEKDMKKMKVDSGFRYASSTRLPMPRPPFSRTSGASARSARRSSVAWAAATAVFQLGSLLCA